MIKRSKHWFSLIFILSLFSSLLLFAVDEPMDSMAVSLPVQQERAVIRVSNVFYETDLRQALDDLSAQSGVPIIADNTVQGFITMEINDLPLEKALSRILSIGGFTFKKIDDYYLVGLADPTNPSFSLLSVSESIPVNYLPAETAVELISDFYKPFIRANKVTNTISITASNELIEKIKKDLKGIDKKPRQVMIEAVVTEVKNQDLTSVGIDWSLFGENEGTTKSSNAKLSTGLLDTLNAFFSIGIIKPGFLGSMDMVADLRALIQDGNIEIKANPKVITTNGQPAEIYIAKEQYFSVVTGPLNYPYTRLEKVSVGIKLQITPFISENDEITVQIVPEVSDAIGYGREGLPVVDTRKVNTTVRVKDGQTITLGGLTQTSTRHIQNKIPILGHIPILGYLFSHTKYEKVKTDIVIFITPRIKPDFVQE